MCLCVCECVSIYIYIYTHISIYIYTHYIYIHYMTPHVHPFTRLQLLRLSDESGVGHGINRYLASVAVENIRRSASQPSAFSVPCQALVGGPLAKPDSWAAFGSDLRPGGRGSDWPPHLPLPSGDSAAGWTPICWTCS